MKGRMSVLRHILDPFEFLYLAIAIATFEHSTWTAAFMWEGVVPTNPDDLRTWYFRGALIAIAIDVGMLMASRFIAATTDKEEVITLVAVFSFAALASLFTQVGYILHHTPSFEVSPGVSSYWSAALTPIIEARVVLLPFFLPIMGTLYTVARIFRTKRIKREARAIQISQSQAIRIETLADMVRLLDEGTRPKLPQEILDDEFVDWEGLRFYDVDKGVWRGKYPSMEVMLTTMRNLADKRQKELPAPVGTKELPAPTDTSN